MAKKTGTDNRELLTEEKLRELIDGQVKVEEIVDKYKTSAPGLLKRVYSLSVRDGKMHQLPGLLGSENVKTSGRGIFIPLNRLKETQVGDKYNLDFDENKIILQKVA